MKLHVHLPTRASMVHDLYTVMTPQLQCRKLYPPLLLPEWSCMHTRVTNFNFIESNMERRSKKRGREGERERKGKGQERRERREGARVDKMERKRVEGRERKRGRRRETIGRKEGRKK